MDGRTLPEGLREHLDKWDDGRGRWGLALYAIPEAHRPPSRPDCVVALVVCKQRVNDREVIQGGVSGTVSDLRRLRDRCEALISQLESGGAG